MKKLFTFILLSLFAVNSNLFSMDKEQKKIETTSPQKQQLSKMDMAKIGAASLGLAFFGAAFAMTYDAKIKFDNTVKPSLCHLPTCAMVIFFSLCWDNIYSAKKYRPSKVLFGNVAFGLTALSSFALAAGCGTYVYKKLSSSKTNKTVKA